jgi:Protein of unknown function (DUF2442)
MARRDRFRMAERRAKAVQASVPSATAARYDQASDRVVVNLSSKLDVSFSPHDAQGLEHAKPSQLQEIEITASGLGLHFPQLDADIYVPSLLEGFLGSKRWMAARLGQTGGRSKSLAKKAASRANGKLGGRPKKVARR